MARKNIKVAMITISNVCPVCDKFYQMEVPFAGFMAYEGGVLVQNAFPTLSPSERECIISGLCTTCQDKIFGSDD
jgi:hypothetical protein